jgi:1,4-alpha-glucan branching enzyme
MSGKLGRKATLDDIPDNELDRLAEMGFDWIWFLSVWTTGEMGQKISRENCEWRHDFEMTLPDLMEQDIAGSGFAITGYNVHPDLGGDKALERLRKRLQKRGLKLMLDFVPNHIAPDHPWVRIIPIILFQEQNDLEKIQNIQCKSRMICTAYGRDHIFRWPDTCNWIIVILQL